MKKIGKKKCALLAQNKCSQVIIISPNPFGVIFGDLEEGKQNFGIDSQSQHFDPMTVNIRKATTRSRPSIGREDHKAKKICYCQRKPLSPGLLRRQK